MGLLLGVSCKHSYHNPSLTSPSSYGGKEYKSFVELPPYFVEWQYRGYGVCSGAHIGDGYILTTAHCVDEFLCHKKEEAKAISLRYITRGLWGDSYEAYSNYHDIEAIVMHKHYFVHPDAHIALIKVQPDFRAPFAGKALLPTAGAALYSPQHVRGVLYQHGIGKEFSNEYKEYRKLELAKKSKGTKRDEMSPFKDNRKMSTSYFGGSMQVVPVTPKYSRVYK
ncbi:MAG: trypsin-like serine protease [Proteobacteria bacterium]|nr:trypsin-like serine protease [Pseudomonadota bacterium]